MTKPTIRKGSTGDAVREWQGIVKVVVDGAFGPATEAATKEFQKGKKLVPDGVVGPLTWAAALGTPIATVPQKSASASTDAWAYNVSLHAAPDMPMTERQYALAVARGEGFYGKGWGNPSQYTRDLSATYGLRGDEGAGSNNWGAVQGSGSGGSFPHVDHHADGSPYVNPYKRYKTPEEGFLDMARILLKPNVKEALKKGDIKAAVFTQHANKYFELKPELYLQAVKRNYGQLRANLDWPEILKEGGKTAWGKILGGLAIAGATIGVGVKVLLRKSR